MLGQREFAPIVALIHPANLRNRHVAFIGKDNRIVRDKLKQRGGWFTRSAACQIARIVLNPVANAGRLKHFKIKVAALLKPLGFQQFSLIDQLVEPQFELFLNLDDGLLHRRLWRHVVRIRVDPDPVKRVGLFARQRVEFGDLFKLFAKERQPPRAVFKVRRENLQHIPANTE